MGPLLPLPVLGSLTAGFGGGDQDSGPQEPALSASWASAVGLGPRVRDGRRPFQGKESPGLGKNSPVGGGFHSRRESAAFPPGEDVPVLPRTGFVEAEGRILRFQPAPSRGPTAPGRTGFNPEEGGS